MDEQDWLAARFEQHRPRLRAVAYRMLGSLSEARPTPDRSALVDWFAAEQGARARRLLEDPAGVLRKATEHSLTDLQSGLLAASKQLHDRGHPISHP